MSFRLPKKKFDNGFSTVNPINVKLNLTIKILLNLVLYTVGLEEWK